MKTIEFNRNWNGKLKNDVFTTIRLKDMYGKYTLGENYEIWERNSNTNINHGIGQIICIRTLTIDQLDEFQANLDTGYSAEATRTIIRTMYKSKNLDWNTQQISIYLIKKIKVQNTQKQLF